MRFCQARCLFVIFCMARSLRGDNSREITGHVDVGIVWGWWSAYYEVNPEEKSCTIVYGGDIQAYLLNEERTILALITSTKIIFIDDKNEVLSSDRVSLDGIINPKFEDNCLAGEAYDPMCDCYVPFTVDVKTGAVQGGSFNVKPFTL